MRPTECPSCETWAYRNGRCAHCEFEEPTELRGPSPWPDPDQRDVGRRGIAEARKKLEQVDDE